MSLQVASETPLPKEEDANMTEERNSLINALASIGAPETSLPTTAHQQEYKRPNKQP